MAPAAASLLSATSSAPAASSKRPAAASGAEALLAQGDQEGAARKNQQQQQLGCPRCGSINTKFCYYNNYSTAQPRHFCRACRRYWTQGGTLRNVPVGGACRRGGNKRRRAGSSSAEPPSSAASPTSAARAEDAYRPDLPTTFPFLSDGAVFFPQFDLGIGGVAPAAFSWPAAAPDLYDGLAARWGDGTLAAGVTGAWDNFTGLELSWPPPAGN